MLTKMRMIIVLTWLAGVFCLPGQVMQIEPVRSFGGWISGVVAQGNYAYISQGERLVVLDLSDPANPTETGSVFLPGLRSDVLLTDLFLQGNYVYGIGENIFVIVDVSAPAAPVVKGACVGQWLGGRVHVAGDYAYLACQGSFRVVNVAEPANARVVHENYLLAKDVFVANDRLYILTSSGLRIYDLSDPANPELLYSKGGAAQGEDMLALSVRGDYAYIVSSIGLRIDRLTDVEDVETDGFFGFDCRSARIVVGEFYADLGLGGASGDGYVRLNITDPANPQQANRFAVDEVEDIGMQDGRVLLARKGRLDIVRVETPQLAIIGQFNPQPMAVQTLVSDSNLYVVGDCNLEVYSLEDPANPAHKGGWSGPNRIRKVAMTGARAYVAPFAAVNPAGGGGYLNTAITILDVSDPANIIELGRYDPGRLTRDLFAQGDRLYLVAEAGGSWFEVVQVTDPAQPVKLGEQELSGGRALSVSGNIAYVAELGFGAPNLVLYDVANPGAPVERSRIETVPWPSCVSVSDSTAFVGGSTLTWIEDQGYVDWWWLQAIDVSNPDQPSATGGLEGALNGPGTICGADTRDELGMVFAAIVGGSVWFTVHRPYTSYLPAEKCPSPGSLSVAKTAPRANESFRIYSGHVYSAEGFDARNAGFDRWGDNTGRKGVYIGKYQLPYSGALEIKIEPPEAAAYGCTAEPALQFDLPIGSTVTVTAIEANKWNFSRWSGAAAGNNPTITVTITDDVTRATAHFVKPVLTLSYLNQLGPIQVCPNDPKLQSEEFLMLDLKLAAKKGADWWVQAITFKANGVNGHDVDDIEYVKLNCDDTEVGRGTFDQDNGTITFQVERPIQAPAFTNFIHLTLSYKFKLDVPVLTPFARLFSVETQTAWVEAYPALYPNGEKLPELPFSTTLAIAPVLNLNTLDGFAAIQPAIDDSDTKAGHTIQVCPGTYVENVKVTKPLTIRAKLPERWGSESPAIVQAQNPNDHVFEMIQPARIEGLTIQGANGAAVTGPAGFYVNSVSNCVSSGNIVQSNIYGIYARSASAIGVSGKVQHNVHGIYLSQVRDANIGGATIAYNEMDGIYAEQVQDMLIGHTVPTIIVDGNYGPGEAGEGAVERANIIQTKKGHCIHLKDSPNSNVRILNNWITGAPDSSNGAGILIEDSTHVTLGSWGGNVIVFNGTYGIHLKGSGFNSVNNVTIQGNVIGRACDLLSGAEWRGGNRQGGIQLEGAVAGAVQGVLIGRTNMELGVLNQVSGNLGPGIILSRGSAGTTVAGNFIGLGNRDDNDLRMAMPNTGCGIAIGESSSNLICENWIVGNEGPEGGVGIYVGIDGLAQGTKIVGNDTRLSNASGTLNSGQTNQSRGIAIANARQTQVYGNEISNNSCWGIEVLYPAQEVIIQHNIIENNLIEGVCTRNGMGGIKIQGGRGVLVGGTTGPEGNIIFNNGGPGIALLPWRLGATVQNTILRNSFENNAGLAIDLATGTERAPRYGVTENDPLDADGDDQPNLLQNFPVLEQAVSSAGVGTVIRVGLNSRPLRRFVLQFYGNQKIDPTGYGQGETYLGSKDVITDAAGNTSFTLTTTSAVAVGHYITATATDQDGNTSEFSKGIPVTAAKDSDLDGVTDLLEKGAAHNGDANQDEVPDVNQGHVASYATPEGDIVTLTVSQETMQGILLKNLQRVTQPAPTNAPAGVEFPLGFVSFEVHTLSPGQQTLVELLLAKGRRVNCFYKYGPTPDDPTPHWYRFDYDGQLGAICTQAKLWLHLRDGHKGDDDLTPNSAIKVLGAPAVDPVLLYLSNIPNTVIDEDTSTGPISFTVGGGGTPENNLLIAALSENPLLVPLENLVLGGSGAERTVAITPGLNLNGIAPILVTVSDGLNEVSHRFTLQVNSVNDPPFTISDGLLRPADQPVKVSSNRLLSNDQDVDGNALVLTGVNPASSQGATVNLQDDWVFYQPPPGFNGQDTFTYTVSDRHGGSATGTVTVSLAGADNDATDNIIDISDVPDTSHKRIMFVGIPGQTYEIQASPTLSNPVWQTIGTQTANGIGFYYFEDTEAGHFLERYYRSRRQ